MNKELLKQFGEEISKVAKPKLSATKKLSLRKEILNNASLHSQKETCKEPLYYVFHKLIRKIKTLAKKVIVDNETKVDLKTRILSLAEINPQFTTPVWLRVFTLKKATAYIMIMVFSMFSFMMYSVDRNVVFAKESTLIEELRGEVIIVRDGENINAEEYMELLEGDIVITSSNGFAVIRYFDDSISRLSSNTELLLNKLFQDSSNKSKFKIELELNEGRTWVHVMDIVNKESLFSVESTGTKTKVNEKAVFDVQVNKEEKTQVSVFQNNVDVEVTYLNKKSSKVVSQGHQLSAETEKQSTVSVVVLPTIKSEPWIALNSQKDSIYLSEVKEDKEEEVSIKAGLLPDDAFYAAKIMKEQTNLMVTLDDIDKVKLELDYAENRALEAAALLQDGEDELAETAIKEFTDAVEGTKEDVDDSVVLKEYAEEKLDSLEKGFQLIDEDNSLELVTTGVEEAHSLLLEVPELEFHESSEEVEQELVIIKEGPIQEDMAIIEEVIIVEYLEVLE